MTADRDAGGPVTALSSEHEALLAGYDGPEPDRVRQAMRDLAAGNPASLPGLIRAATTDYRDVLAWDDQRRTGRPAPQIDIERLEACLSSDTVTASPDPGSVTPGDGSADEASLVLIDSGGLGMETSKVLRRVTGLGLAEVHRLGTQTPVVIASAMDRTEAEHLSVELERSGARVELRPPT